jgi:hypothetical protein
MVVCPRRRQPVIPILRGGDFDLLPGELSLQHYDDFRDDVQYPAPLARLIANFVLAN